MKTYISLCELLQPGGNAIVGQRYCSNGRFLVVFMIMAIVMFRETIVDDFQHIPASLAWYLCCHPSRRQQPQKLILMLKRSSWTGQCKNNGHPLIEKSFFDSKTYWSTRVFCVCVSPLLKAPLLLADWLPARNLRVSFSFSLKSLISSMDAC